MTPYTLEQVQAQAATMLSKVTGTTQYDTAYKAAYERLAALDTEDKLRNLSLPEQDQLNLDMAAE